MRTLQLRLSCIHTYIRTYTYIHTYQFTFSIFHHLLCLSFLPCPSLFRKASCRSAEQGSPTQEPVTLALIEQQ